MPLRARTPQVLSGGVMLRASLFPRVRVRLQSMLNGYLRVPELTTQQGVDRYLVPSTWGNDAGLVGALTLAARAKHDAAGGGAGADALSWAGGGGRGRSTATAAVLAVAAAAAVGATAAVLRAGGPGALPGAARAAAKAAGAAVVAAAAAATAATSEAVGRAGEGLLKAAAALK